jgi:predicted DNA-binding transcriptional regulator AlpA
LTRKREIERPYPPEYVSAETAAYLLDCSRTTLDDYVRRGLLPKPLGVGALTRWRWRDLDAFILAHNGIATGEVRGAPSEAEDGFQRGIKRVAAAHA